MLRPPRSTSTRSRKRRGDQVDIESPARPIKTRKETNRFTGPTDTLMHNSDESVPSERQNVSESSSAMPDKPTQALVETTTTGHHTEQPTPATQAQHEIDLAGTTHNLDIYDSKLVESIRQAKQCLYARKIEDLSKGLQHLRQHNDSAQRHKRRVEHLKERQKAIAAEMAQEETAFARDQATFDKGQHYIAEKLHDVFQAVNLIVKASFTEEEVIDLQHNVDGGKTTSDDRSQGARRNKRDPGHLSSAQHSRDV